MSSRFPPSSGFNSRDRSPQRFGDRRPPVGPRGPDDGPAPFGRDPPRGPRALVDSPRGGHFGGRGRGYGRGDFRDRDPRDRDRDRDFRDNRDGPPFRRDMDRDWVRRDREFDPRDNRIGFGRGRSRSPTRDFRDIREPPGRDFDLARMRRNSRDSIISASSGGPEGPPPNGGHIHRGGIRGRGRGDWEGGRGRGRPSFLDDRDLFRRRSRSREQWRGRDRMVDRDRDRDMDRDRALDRDRMMDRDRDRDLPRPRDRDRELDRDLDRRDRFDRREDWDNRRPDREDRDRPVDFWKRDRPPSRAASRAASGSTTSSHPTTAPGPGPGPTLADRLPDHPQVDHGRKPSGIPIIPTLEPTRDPERNDPRATGARPDAIRLDTGRPDAPRPDVVRPVNVQPDAPRPDAARADAVRPVNVRPDAPRPDASRPDAPRPDVVRPVNVRPDAPRPDAPRPVAVSPVNVRPDAPRPDASRPDAPRPDAPRPDVVRPVNVRPDADRPDAPRPDVVRPVNVRPDAPRPDAARADAVRPVDIRPDASRPDAARPDAVRPVNVRPDAPRPDTSRPDASRPDAPRPDFVRPINVRPDAPRPDAPRSDAPRPDDVRPDAARSGAPRPHSRPDVVRPDAIRPDAMKNPPIIRNSPPPAAPQVPAFGSVAAHITNASNKDFSDQRTASNSTFPAERDQHAVPQWQPPQPPTGPKAERTDITQPLEPCSRFEGPQEVGKQRIAPPRLPKPTTNLPDVSPPTAPAAMTRLDSGVGPNEGFAAGRSNSLTSSPTFARIPPPAPRALSREPSMSPRMQSSGIPTGPRALKWNPSPRGRKGSKQWVRPGYGRTPSIPNALPKHEPVDESEGVSFTNEATRPLLPVEIDEPESGEILPHDHAREPSPVSPSLNLPLRRSLSAVDIQTSDANEPSGKGGIDKPALIPDFEGSSDEEDGENIVFTQEYLDERKRIFEKDMESLRAELPPSPLEDSAIVALLLKIQLLGMVANEETAEPPVEPLAEPALERPVDPLPSVEDEESADHPSTERVVSFASTPPEPDPEPITETIIPPVVPPDEVTVEGLPFLHSGPPTPISDMDVYHDNIATQSRLRDAFSTQLSKVQAETFRKNAILRDEYVSHYKLWRMAIWELDRMKDKKSVTPGPASPPVSTVATTPAPMPEGREGRRYKGNSELDFLNALKASEISAQEELERRRIKMATARPDLGREAIIPNMLEPREVKARIYKDVNNTIECNRALDVFGFAPPPNDFTPEEHMIFTDAFMAHPKQWGKIAESLPGRNFQQCIVHYYLTKEEIKYKAKLSKRWSKRKGTRKGPRPKSNALIADLSVVKPDFVGEDEPPAVTDTGRPRRAAAPTFGESAEAESVPVGRRTQLGKDGEPVERSSRRGARGGGTRGGRRAKTATQPDPKTQVATPQGSLPPIVSPAPLHPGSEIELVPDHIMEGYEARERERAEKESLTPIPRGRVGRGRAKEGVYVFESTEVEPSLATKQHETGYGSLQPTSYWSVPEQRDFPALLGHFGRDFEGISGWMKTKTTVMVKNFYQRRLDSGQKDFELILTDAEEKKARGEPTGPLPIPSVAPKRRYEATPSSIIPRPLAPHGDPMAEVDEIRFPKGKAVGLSPQPMSLHGRPPSDKERNVGRYQPLAQASAASPVPSTATLIEESTRAIRAQGGPSHRIQGPRLGYFTEDRRDSSVLPHATARTQDLPMSSRHPGSLPPDMGRMEPLSAQGYMPAQQPTSLLSSTHSRHPSLTQPPGSPTQQLRPELDISSVHRDPFAQRPYYSLAGQPIGLAQSPRPGLSPVKDVPRQSATPAPDATRQVPAKRSNIMSILNDEPEEPQPRKRFASEQAPSAPGATPGINPRPVYQTGAPPRHEDTIISGMSQKPSSYAQQSQYQPSSRGYDYPGYGPPHGGSGTTANNDWVARFDPRAQQTPPQPQAQSLPSQQQQSGRQGSYSSYAATPSQSSVPLTNLPVPSPAPTPPPTSASQRSAYPNVFSQASSAQPPMASGSRDMAPQPTSYRQGSPGPRSSMAYGSRQDPPTPAQSSASLYGMHPRQSATQNAVQSHSYQQHVQTMVSGSHQPQSHRSTPVNLPGASSQYGHNTPPPQSQAGRSMASLASLGRSYTPPSALHPSMSGGTMSSYAPPQSSTPGSIPPLHQRPTGSLGDTGSTPTHHRVYSHGSAQGGLPPPSQPPR
ncbi:hypothetical protein N7447_003199 [Penicillium robsamsonii]|uniref:uncharacterized protein n=1 Tax=Penicillium robsamsonii TaxID=1792511 RepID=UPI00254971AF|nr:uncharacterized protein N7447_003199 [Penicillium robsamsonii]KAJ5837173.1 hypothetical protein N7447_003199 [Penicillium robsamsonii]